jgi:glycosyltransferase involved in cell wall biosynthesis
MHICHVTSALAGGPATSIALLSARQAEAGHEVSLVYSSSRDEIWPFRRRFDHLRAAVPWRVGRAIGPGDLFALAELVQILRRLAPDMVHLHCSKAGALGRLVTRLLGLPAVYSPRGVAFVRPFGRKLYQMLESCLGQGGEPVVACSESEAAALRRVARSVKVIPNAVELRAITDIVISEAAPNPSFTVGILGLVKDQRLPTLVRQMCERAPLSWRWLWVGDGPLRDLLERPPNLEVTGWRDHHEALHLISKVDVVLHASRWEGMPNTLLEAMALGKAVVVSDVVGTRDVVDDGVDGLLVRDVHAVEPYLAALERLAGDPELRRSLGARARQRVLRDHDGPVVAAQWEAVYRQAMNDLGRARSAVNRSGVGSANQRRDGCVPKRSLLSGR